MVAIIAGISWLIGIILGALLVPQFQFLVIPLWGSVICAAALWRLGRPVVPIICVALVLLGATRYSVAHQELANLDLVRYNGVSSVSLRGVICDEPDPRGDWELITLDRIEVAEGDVYHPVVGRLQVRTGLFEGWRVGDTVEVRGRLQNPPVIDGFAYGEYLRRQGIVSASEFPALTLVARNTDGGAAGALGAIRSSLERVLSVSLPEPQAGVARGVVLGGQGGLSPALKDAFNRSGTTHVLAVSGFNIAILASALALVTRRVLRPAPATIVSLLGVVVYTLTVGGQPSAVRAAIMGGVIIAANLLGRKPIAIASLLLAAGLMAAFDPLVIWDLGFQLSFLATGGLVAIAPLIDRFVQRVPPVVKEGLTFTIAAQVATLPITLTNFQQVSIVAIPCNVLITPVLPVITVLSLCTAGAGLITPYIGTLLGVVTNVFVSYVLLVVEALGSISWAALPTGVFPAALAWLYYAVIGIVLIGAWRSSMIAGLRLGRVTTLARPKPLLASVGVIAVVVWLGALTVPRDDVSVTFLNVGQGDATLIKTASRVVLVDGGPTPEGAVDAVGRRLPFWSRRLDLVVVTHPDEDHLMGLTEIVRRFEIGQVLQADYGARPGLYQDWLARLKDSSVPVVTAFAGQRIRLDEGVEMTVLHAPTGNLAGSNANESSLVLRVSCGEHTVLITGDASANAQRAILDSDAALRSAIMQVPHHGAEDGLSPAFLEAVSPQVAVISVGRNNRFGHPAASTLRALDGVRVLRTDVDGSVEIVVRDGQCLVTTSLR